MAEKSTAGHRQRLKERFLEGEEHSHSDEALLELLLTYAIPQKDVKPLAKRLLVEFGSLSSVLDAPVDSLLNLDGIKFSSVALLKLVEWIRLHHAVKTVGEKKQQFKQLKLIDDLPAAGIGQPLISGTKKELSRNKETIVHKHKVRMFSIPALRESISLLPQLPKTEDLEEIKALLRNNLHYSSKRTRQDYAAYIVKRMFPMGYADPPMHLFAVNWSDQQEFRDVCFYRFGTSEPLMKDIVINVVLPAIGQGKLPRDRIRAYLENRFGRQNKNVENCVPASVTAMVDCRIVNEDRKTLCFSYREIQLASFAFILHSEFPEPGMYDLAKVEDNMSIRTMLWHPSRILPSLYELRNMGLISKISEIDNVRQFTTRWTLDQAVELLISGGKRP